ncbi:Dyp-type peroxidase [Amycolatopsis saalfeldensis]|uniref:Dyp-type peroxidase family n=1 Tax=Amycolatopsis saalfeldensis TaxID=394193 RepID=A0A1H8YN79_9PSEU|nr:Dyp-type peroxidase [Amycolatopsis saalfeldensis]SEP52828.1 Dyp-type peroxidase family [Amycolatopsis saalfeldensis]
MAVDLTSTLAWTTASGDAATMLDELQPNILKAHARDHLSVLFLRFGENRKDAAAAKGFLAALANQQMKSAKTQLQEISAFKAAGTGGTPYVGVGLTAAGYHALGVKQVPQDESFLRGMRDPATRQKLADPPRSTFDPGYHGEIHAVVLIGDAADGAMTARRNEVLALLPDSVTVLAEEAGLGRTNSRGEGIEHFGYVDGRSQPLFLAEDVDAEKNSTDGINVWDPSAPLSQVLVADVAAPDPAVHFGSYFVFRKLEQNVRRFKQAELDLAGALGLTGDDRERAGAMIIGRFEDGTPLTTQREDGAESPVSNNFTYDSDLAAAKCPFQAHIRKTNPRGSGGFEEPADERLHLMARRGVPYGERADDPNADVPPAQRPSGGVGLLFMAFNSALGNQFEFTQATWADNPGFPKAPVKPGLDPVIGQGPRESSEYVPGWGGTTTVTAPPVPQAVTCKGGDYFFMPSLAFLRSLA